MICNFNTDITKVVSYKVCCSVLINLLLIIWTRLLPCFQQEQINFLALYKIRPKNISDLKNVIGIAFKKRTIMGFKVDLILKGNTFNFPLMSSALFLDKWNIALTPCSSYKSFKIYSYTGICVIDFYWYLWRFLTVLSRPWWWNNKCSDYHEHHWNVPLSIRTVGWRYQILR